MFYIKEFILHFKYVCLSFFFFFFNFYFYKNLIFIFFSDILQNSVLHFIYTNPFELLNIYIDLYIYLSFYFIFPFIFWHIIDFLKTGFFIYEFQFLTYYLISFCISFYFFNTFCLFYLLPKFWIIFEVFNNSSLFFLFVNIFYELKIADYFQFLFNFLMIFNMSFFFFFSIYNLFIFLGVKKLIYYKIFLIVINILLATFLSPPELISQIFYIFILSCILEIYFFISLLQKKYSNSLILFNI